MPLKFMSPDAQMRRRQRRGHGTGLVASALILAAAYALEWGAGMEPCPLCMVQRLVFAGMGAVFLLAFLHGAASWGRWVYAGLAALIAAAGVGIAGRHLWIQSLPDEAVPTCGPGLDYMVETFGVWDALTTALEGSGGCAEVHPVLGLPLPAWTLAGYLLLGGWALLIARRPE